LIIPFSSTLAYLFYVPLGNGESGLSKGDKKVLKHIKTPAHEDGDANQ